MRRDASAHGPELVVVAGLTGVLNFIYVVYAGRSLPPAEYADFWAALSAIFVFTLLLNPFAPFASQVAAGADGSVGIAAFRREQRRRLAPFAAGCLILAVVAGPFVASVLHFRSASSLEMAAATVAIYGFVVLDRGLLQGLQQFRAYNVNMLLESAVRLLVTIVALTLTKSAAAPMLAYLAGTAAAAVALVGRFPRATGPSGIDARGIATPIFVLMLGAAVFQNIDTFAVKRWLPLAAGEYAAAAVFGRTASAAAVPFYVLLIPAVVRARDRQGAVALALRITAGYAGLSGVLLLASGTFASSLCTAMFGASYAGAAWMVLPVVGLMCVCNITLLLTQALVTMAKTRILYAYTTVAGAEILALIGAHETVRMILLTLYAGQLVLLSVVVVSIAVQRRVA